ncbi:hypothetical protein AB0A69_05020 [Streptomyces sp. NPDC045431]|uniref:hypothetical protein n=1 Tax=Streptomyces sp. NPDC045431 TaxID=3155613 RepID=UPI0033CDF373
MSTKDNAPPVWFRLPPGFHSLETITDEGLMRAVTSVVTPLLGQSPEADQALRDARVLTELITALFEQGTAFLAFGLHPDGAHGACMSLFSLSTISTAAPSPHVAAARTGITLADSSAWRTRNCRLLELPSGIPAAMVAGTLAPPMDLVQRAGISPRAGEVFQARIAVPYPSGSHVVVADLASAATRHADSYTDILEGIAHTLSFSHPEDDSNAASAAPTSRLLEFLT